MIINFINGLGEMRIKGDLQRSHRLPHTVDQMKRQEEEEQSAAGEGVAGQVLLAGEGVAGMGDQPAELEADTRWRKIK